MATASTRFPQCPRNFHKASLLPAGNAPLTKKTKRKEERPTAFTSFLQAFPSSIKKALCIYTRPFAGYSVPLLCFGRQLKQDVGQRAADFAEPPDVVFRLLVQLWIVLIWKNVRSCGVDVIRNGHEHQRHTRTGVDGKQQLIETLENFVLWHVNRIKNPLCLGVLRHMNVTGVSAAVTIQRGNFCLPAVCSRHVFRSGKYINKNYFEMESGSAETQGRRNAGNSPAVLAH